MTVALGPDPRAQATERLPSERPGPGRRPALRLAEDDSREGKRFAHRQDALLRLLALTP